MKPPNPLVWPLLEWRAARIEDPVERLRYLQSATARLSRPLVDVNRLRRVRWLGFVPVALWACVFVPVPVPSTVHSTVLRERGRTNSEDKPAGAVWLVEDNSGFEIYSNGLRVEKEFSTANRFRGSYAVFRRGDPAGAGSREEPFDTRSKPAGIVFHSTESHQAPFEPAETRNLKRLGRNLLEYIRQKRAYHYVVDRFGRVYRVVAESDAANHAGKSVWADDKGSYVFLNDSFIGIALESQSDSESTLSTAQVHATRVLTEMLRAKYGIAAANCITHAQVSVNPSNRRIGYHTDWATGFPFKEVGLPDNYHLQLPSVTTFGFESDEGSTGDRTWPGLRASLEVVREQALAAGLPAAEYRRRLQQRFQNIMNSAAMRERGEEQ